MSDLSGEGPRHPGELYGLDDANPLTAAFGRNCLLARRLLERGVRFVTLYNGAFAMGEGARSTGTVTGGSSPTTTAMGRSSTAPPPRLLRDLKARGLLDDTLVLLTTEFGRMPTFQKGAEGRDHKPVRVHGLDGPGPV